jgi:hypothetical protein
MNRPIVGGLQEGIKGKRRINIGEIVGVYGVESVGVVANQEYKGAQFFYGGAGIVGKIGMGESNPAGKRGVLSLTGVRVVGWREKIRRVSRFRYSFPIVR